MVSVGSLAKPDQEEIRAAAMPILCAARRRRTGRSSLAMAHQGVNAMQLRAVEKGWIKHPFTPSEASSDYVEALVQLADDANWLAREIPLPNHPAPKHPPIYYTRNPITGVLFPGETQRYAGIMCTPVMAAGSPGMTIYIRGRALIIGRWWMI